MRVLICTVQGAFGNAENNQPRQESLDQLLSQCSVFDVDLVVMPGGYFGSSSAPEHANQFSEIKASVEKHQIPISFGVDTNTKQRDPDDTKVQRYRLPSFAFAWTPDDGWCGPWRQRSTNSSNQAIMPPHLAEETRVIQVRGRRVGVLVCGEIFNRSVERSLRALEAVMVADLVHSGHHFRFHDTARRWTGQNPIRAAFMSCHTGGSNGTKRWALDGNYDSTATSEIVIEQPVRIEATIISCEM